ncbi:putative bark agglutinin LECRPA3-like, partial [Trifolium medium]|nr:putative bark agglutinin LECRPA3-like [Trifolium medium]
NSQKSVSFNFDKFTPGQSSLTLQGSAKISSSGILGLTNSAQTTPNVGRVLYSTPVPIWDSKTGKVASFVTSFSFVIETLKGFTPADGLIFFLSDPTNTTIPDNSGQGYLGVVDANKALNKFVGVEFDNYANPWDPSYKHIGINVNSIYSSKTVKWNWVSGSLLNVNIIYDSLSTTLNVVVKDNNGDQLTTISQLVDLKSLLSEKAVIGLSGSSGDRQAHDIYSWSFTSTLDTTTTNNIASF